MSLICKLFFLPLLFLLLLFFVNYHGIDNPNPDSQFNQSSLKPGLLGFLSGLILIQIWVVHLLTQNLNLG